MDDTYRSHRAPLALAPSETCRRWGESATSPDLKTWIATRALPPRCSEDGEVEISWESRSETTPRGYRETPPADQR